MGQLFFAWESEFQLQNCTATRTFTGLFSRTRTVPSGANEPFQDFLGLGGENYPRLEGAPARIAQHTSYPLKKEYTECIEALSRASAHYY